MELEINYEAFEGVHPSLVDEWVREEIASTPDPGFYDDYYPQTNVVLPKSRLIGGYNPITSMLENARS